MSSSYTPATLEYLRVVEVPDLIRLGSKYDGGYVVPRSCVIESDMLLSFGISSDWNFEKDFHGLNRAAPIHAYDHTVSQKIFGRRAFVALLRALAKRTSFADFFGEWKTLSDWKKTAGIMNHHQRRVSNRAGHPIDITIDEIFEEAKDKKKVFIKMDIEGSEYRTLPKVLRYSDQIAFMVVEFHDSEALRLTFEAIISQIRQEFEIVHIHGNNFGEPAVDGLPDSLEISFLHKSLIPRSSAHRRSIYLENLDAPCNPDKEEIYVPAI